MLRIIPPHREPPRPRLVCGKLSASVSATSPSIDESSLWSEAAIVYRRICLLRLRGQSLEAARLQSTELSRAIGALREALGNSAECEAKLSAVFAREDDRIADASVLAEVLLPLLRESPPAIGHFAPASATSSRSTASVSPSRPRAKPATAPGIADFIDEMIQLEGAPPRASAS